MYVSGTVQRATTSRDTAVQAVKHRSAEDADGATMSAPACA